MNTDTIDLWAFDWASPLKTLDDEGRFEGLAVPFGDADLSAKRDRFTPETNFGRALKSGSDLLYYHGLPVIEGREPNPLADTLLGEAEYKTTDAGVWMTGQMKIRDDYERAVWGAVKKGKLGLSTGVASHRVRREKDAGGGHTLKSWPIDEVSLTPSPAHPRTSVYALKTLMSAIGPPESAGFVESLKRAESALAWASSQPDLNGVKLDAVKSLGESLRKHREGRIDPERVRAGIETVNRLLTRTKG